MLGFHLKEMHYGEELKNVFGFQFCLKQGLTPYLRLIWNYGARAGLRLTAILLPPSWEEMV